MKVCELINKLQDAINCGNLNGDSDVVIFDDNTSYDLVDINTNYNGICFISMEYTSQDKNNYIIGEINMCKDISDTVKELWNNYEFKDIMDKYVASMFFDDMLVYSIFEDGTTNWFRSSNRFSFNTGGYTTIYNED